MAQRIFIVDTEATGRSPFSGVMSEFGIVELESMGWFYGMLYHAAPHPDIPALPVLTGQPGQLFASGPASRSVHDVAPTEAESRTEVVERLNEWVESFGGTRNIMISDNNGFDAAWMAYHADEAGVDNVFGFSSRRIGDLAAGLKRNWRETSSWKRYRKTKHTHHPVDDAMGNAEALRTLLTNHDQRL